MTKLPTSALAAFVALGALGACQTGEPVYIDPAPRAIEVDPANMMSPSAIATVRLPVRQETQAGAHSRPGTQSQP